MLTALCLSGFGCGASASTGLEFEFAGDTAVLVGLGACTDTDIVVPDTVDGKKVVKIGFEWDSIESLKKCIESEYKEFDEAVKAGDYTHMEDEMGDIFFATVNLARWHKIDAEQALLRANKKFTKRFKKMEELATKPLEEYTYEEFDKLWKQAKKLTE